MGPFRIHFHSEKRVFNVLIIEGSKGHLQTNASQGVAKLLIVWEDGSGSNIVGDGRIQCLKCEDHLMTILDSQVQEEKVSSHKAEFDG